MLTGAIAPPAIQFIAKALDEFTKLFPVVKQAGDAIVELTAAVPAGLLLLSTAIPGALLQKMYRSQRSSGYINMYEQGTNLINLMEDYEEYKFKPDSLVSAYEKDKDSFNEYRKKMIISLYEYAKKTILKGGKPTLVMDEPELHLDLDHTLGLYTNIIPKLAEHFQIIISSHFCLLPFFKEYHFLPLGYDIPRVKDYIADLIKAEEH